jgi:sulfoxide reductase catalytic subunit YedY
MRIRISVLLVFLVPIVLLIAAAYLQWWLWGLPELSPRAPVGPDEWPFPAWLRITHYVNFFFIILLIRSGLQILMDHPRLYWNVHCTPGTEWLRLTPVEVPKDRVWTAKDDCRYLSPWIGLPGYRHTIGMARHWHFASALFWLANGTIFVVLLFATGQWRRLVPSSWQIIPEAWRVFVHYATLHLPPEQDVVVYGYNALQQVTYFGVVFILAPLAMITGPSMSPAFTNRFRWYPRLPGNRQIGRSLHFLVMCSFVMFLVGHVAMVALTGLARNLNHIVVGTDDGSNNGIYFGLAGIAAVVGFNAAANWLAWRRPRFIQHLARLIVTPVMWVLFDRATPVAQFGPEDISPFLWPNGKVPTSAEWQALESNGFRDYRLKVFGLVENPVELSLADLEKLGKKSQITLHHCIQGWSGIAQWAGLPLPDLCKLVRPRPEARRVFFHSFGEGGEGGPYYDSLSLSNALYAHTLLAYEMNGKLLDRLHGAPLRLRAENQLGFKMVKWIKAIEFVADMKTIGAGEGGYNEDHEYFGELANI